MTNSQTSECTFISKIKRIIIKRKIKKLPLKKRQNLKKLRNKSLKSRYKSINKVRFYKKLSLALILFNFLPFFHISNDDNFGSYNNYKKARFSLLSIPLGKNIFYLLSIRKGKNTLNYFFIYRISFDRIQKRITHGKVDQHVNNYKNYSLIATNEQLEKQEEFLKFRISENTSSLYSLHNKVSFYSTIGLALLGFLGFLLTEIVNIKTFLDIKWLLYSLWGLSFVYAANLVLFVMPAIAVGSFYKSSFSDLRKNSERAALCTSFYRDWYDIRDAVRYYASLVKNIEKYLYLLIGSCILTWICIFILNNFLSYTYDYYIVYLQTHFISSIS